MQGSAMLLELTEHSVPSAPRIHLLTTMVLSCFYGIEWDSVKAPDAPPDADEPDQVKLPSGVLYFLSVTRGAPRPV